MDPIQNVRRRPHGSCRSAAAGVRQTALGSPTASAVPKQEPCSFQHVHEFAKGYGGTVALFGRGGCGDGSDTPWRLRLRSAHARSVDEPIH